MDDRPIGRSVPTQNNTTTERTRTFNDTLGRPEFVFQPSKAVRALDLACSVVCLYNIVTCLVTIDGHWIDNWIYWFL
jgi:hypothetical protein